MPSVVRSEARVARRSTATIARAAFVALVALAGCADRGAPAPPREPEACARIGDRCRLPEGPIGICSETTRPCDEPPCLACMSQH